MSLAEKICRQTKRWNVLNKSNVKEAFEGSVPCWEKVICWETKRWSVLNKSNVNEGASEEKKLRKWPYWRKIICIETKRLNVLNKPNEKRRLKKSVPCWEKVICRKKRNDERVKVALLAKSCPYISFEVKYVIGLGLQNPKLKILFQSDIRLWR